MIGNLAPLEFVRSARDHIKMFTWHGTHLEACSLVMGYGLGGEDDFFAEFQAWLGLRFGRPELAFFVHVLRDALPEASDPAGTLLSVDEDDLAIRRLFDLLEEFLLDRQASAAIGS